MQQDKNLSKADIDLLHQQVPPDYYDKGMKNNFFQWFWHKRCFKMIIREIRKLKANGRVLDLGCHSGDLTDLVRQAGEFESYGIDISSAAIDYGKKRYKDINFICADFSLGVSFPDNYFDVVTAFDVLEHVPAPQNLLTDISRILKDGQWLVIGVPSDSMLFRLVWKIWLKFRGEVWKGTHVNEFGHEDLQDFRRYGFKKISQKSIFFDIWRLIIYRLDKSDANKD